MVESKDKEEESSVSFKEQLDEKNSELLERVMNTLVPFERDDDYRSHLASDSGGF